MTTIVRVIDFETTGTEPTDEVIEYGFCDVVLPSSGSPPRITWVDDSIVRIKTKALSPVVLAVHHITVAQAQAEGVPWAQAQSALGSMFDKAEEGDRLFYAAHNAAFEKQFYNPPNTVWIDTYRVAMHLWPTAPSHSNQALRYYLDLDGTSKDFEAQDAMPAHRALPDAYVTAHMLMRMLADLNVDEMVDITNRPINLSEQPIKFGKHRDTLYKDLPRDYLRWMLGQDFDDDTKYTCREILGIKHPG